MNALYVIPGNMLGIASFEGNTIQKSATCKLQKMFYCFTFFYENEAEIVGLTDSLKKFCKKFFYGKEVCPSSGKLHLQGFMSCNRKMRFNEVKKLVPASLNFRFCKGNEKDNLQYCSKDNDFYEWEKPIEFSYPVTETERILLNDIVKSTQRIFEIPEQSDNFHMALYSSYSCGYFLVESMNSLRSLSFKKGMIILLRFHCSISPDERFGILGIISRGHYQGVIFSGKYLVIG